MYHSITFGSKNTWNDWHLVPTSRPVFDPPVLKERYIDIPGGDGVIDLTESLTGYPVYQNRTGSLEFIVMNDYWPWQEAYSTICDYLHGQRMKAVLEDDRDYYYEGRFKVSKWKSDKYYSTITIEYSVSPYKKRLESTVIHLPVGVTGQSYILTETVYGQAPQCPKLVVQTTDRTNMTVRFINKRLGINVAKPMSNGTQYMPDMVLYGDQVSIFATVPDESSALLDASSGAILDHRGQPLLDSPGGQLDIVCEYGRL